MNWNGEQKQAIEWEGTNLIVSAAAGAGKTAVLTERVKRLIKEGTGIDEMLILTFTRAAAAEMRSRIVKKLAEAECAETDPKKKEYLRRQMLLCPNASISTIDSFCTSVVRRHYYRLDLAPGMGMLSTTEEAILLDEACENAAAEQIAENPEKYHTLLRAFNGTENVADKIRKLHTFLCAQRDRDRWLEDIEAACREGRLTKRAEEKLFERCREELRADIRALKACRDQVNAFGDKYIKHVQHADGMLLKLGGIELERNADPENYGLFLKSILPFEKAPNVLAPMRADGVGEPLKQCRKTVMDTVDEQAKLFAGAEEEETGNAQVTVIVEALLDLLRRTEALFTAAKLEKGKLDFGDIEYYTVRLLAEEEVAREYRQRFKVVIVDEYQDSNDLQEAILERICRPGGVFLVGDIKQSIYGFRMAEPALFKGKTDTYGRGEGGRRIDLNSNFRSSPEVLSAVNSVFAGLMTPETGVLSYDDSQALRCGMDQPAGEAKLVIIDCKEAEDADPDEELENAEAEAMFCVEKIRSIMENELYTGRDGDKPPRPYEYRDFTVLLRSGTAVEKMAKVFTEEGIPCFSESSGGYFESIEVQFFLNLLRIIDNRRQDIPLLSVLRSSVGGMDDEELIALRHQCPEEGKDILACLMRAAETDPAGKAALFLNKLESWRKKSLYMPARELCSLLLDETGVLLEMSMLPGGRQREANLERVLTLAGEYDASGAFGLHGFIRFADKAREKDKVGSAPTVTGNVVRFMTVHKSKGLEFPVVFYCDLGKKFNDKDQRADLLLDSELGIGIKYVDKWHVRREPRLHTLLARRVGAKNREEEMRVLYVGMTRAERKLFMVGSVRDYEKTESKIPALVTPPELRAVDTVLKWLMMLTKEGPAREALPRVLVDKAVYVRSAAPEQPPAEAPDPEKLRRLTEKLSRVYPYPAPAGVPNKTSATALSGGEKVYSFSEDPFREKTESEEGGALRHGTEIHVLLEKMPLEKDREEERRALLAPLPARDRESLEWFLGTELFARMQSSPSCRRELPFTAAVESGTLPGYEAGEKVLLQGVIDCCFIEGEGYILLDYKTDSFRGRTAAEQAETHREQLELYERVLSGLTQKPVLEKYVVFTTERVITRLT